MSNESILSEVVSASVGGAFSASALYPLEVLKTKMQAESKSTSPSTVKHETSTVTESSTNASNGDESEDSIELIGDDISSKGDKNTTTNEKSKSMITYAQDMYKEEGITPFYAGIGTSAFQSATEKALYFFAYTALKNAHSFFTGGGSSKKQMNTATNLILGCCAEWAHLPITLPIDCLTTQIQTGNNGNKGALAILCTMLSEGDGIRGMYKGIQAYTILCLKPAIQYTVFEQVKEIILIRKRLQAKGRSGRKDLQESLSTIEAFLLGMVARTIATIAVFPYLRAKVMLQSQSSQGSGKKKPHIPAMIAQMYNSGGVGEMFQGIGPELTRGVFSAALMMTMKEKIGFVVNKALRN